MIRRDGAAQDPPTGVVDPEGADDPGPSVPVPDLVDRTYPGGTVQLRVERFDGSIERGRVRLDAATHVSFSDVSLLCGSAGITDLDDVLFLDTETTGLAGGAGTFVFLVGLACFKGGVFEVRQWVLPDPAEEEGLLDALTEEAHAARGLVSFHGRGFDIPRIEERFLLAGRPDPFESLPHMDLLIGARRVFRMRTGRVALQELERQVLGVERLDDLPGAECPAAWYAYLKGRPRPLWRVLEHNLLDLLSLPALLAAMAEPAVGRGPAPDLHSAGRVLARAGLEERALALQRGATARAVDGTLRARAHHEASRLLRRQQLAAEAATEAHAATMSDPALPGPWLVLAKDAEHRTKDYAFALACAERVQRLLFLRGRSARAIADARRRIERVTAKLSRLQGAPQPREP